MKSIKNSTVKNIFLWLLIAVFIGAYIFYTAIFIRSSQQNKIIEAINPVPYTTHFDVQQQKPNTFFTMQAFPAYTKWCHENKKLCSIIPMQQLYADIQWLSSIQFIGKESSNDAIIGLSTLLDNLTTLSPYRSYPYTFSQLLVPLPKEWDIGVGGIGSNNTQNTTTLSREKARELAKKGEFYTCDPRKIDAINWLSEEEFIKIFYATGDKSTYINPCPSYERAHYAWFNAFYYQNDANEATRNYKISSFQTTSPTMAPLMAALIYGRWWQHIKSATLRYDRYVGIMAQWSTVDEILKEDADTAIKKAVFELELQIITEADEMAWDLCQKDFSCLQKQWYIKKSIDHSAKTICDNGKNKGNIRCILLAAWWTNKWITSNELTYPIDINNFVFSWNEEYNAWRISPK